MPRIALSLIIALAATSVKAEPSYDDTVSFLQEKLNTTSSFGGDVWGNWNRTVYYFEEVSQCRFKHRYANFANGFSDAINGDQYEFDASKLDASQIEQVPHRARVILRTSNGSNEVAERGLVYNLQAHNEIFDGDSSSYYRYDCSGISCSSPRVTNEVYINAILEPASDNVPRVAKAFEHLIRLCGGDAELF